MVVVMTTGFSMVVGVDVVVRVGLENEMSEEQHYSIYLLAQLRR